MSNSLYSGKKGIVNLKNEMIVDISKPLQSQPKKYGRISARVTIGDPEEAVNEVELKVKTLKFKKVLKGNLWVIAMNTLNKVLENVDPADINKDQDLQKFIEKYIDEMFDKE